MLKTGRVVGQAAFMVFSEVLLTIGPMPHLGETM